MGLLAICGAIWAASRKSLGRSAWPAIALIAFYVVLQIVAMLMPPPAGELGLDTGATVLVVYVVAAAAAGLTDTQRKRTA
jgi:protein-S-isoprenylcysteine O-methyltransferase Ste14